MVKNKDFTLADKYYSTVYGKYSSVVCTPRSSYEYENLQFCEYTST